MPIISAKNKTCGDVLGLKREAPRVLEPIKAKQSDDTTEIRYRLQQQESSTTKPRCTLSPIKKNINWLTLHMFVSLHSLALKDVSCTTPLYAL